MENKTQTKPVVTPPITQTKSVSQPSTQTKSVQPSTTQKLQPSISIKTTVPPATLIKPTITPPTIALPATKPPLAPPATKPTLAPPATKPTIALPTTSLATAPMTKIDLASQTSTLMGIGSSNILSDIINKFSNNKCEIPIETIGKNIEDIIKQVEKSDNVIETILSEIFYNTVNKVATDINNIKLNNIKCLMNEDKKQICSPLKDNINIKKINDEIHNLNKILLKYSPIIKNVYDNIINNLSSYYDYCGDDKYKVSQLKEILKNIGMIFIDQQEIKNICSKIISTENKCPQPICPKPECPKPECPKPECPKQECPQPVCPKPVCPDPVCPQPVCPKPEFPKNELYIIGGLLILIFLLVLIK